jgi:two-component system, OmpR family, response regulator
VYLAIQEIEMRILIVEDDPEISNFLRSSLEAELFSVDIAADGEAGSYLARTNDYDLVILDYALPKKDGREVCSEIRQAAKSMPILMLTVRSELPDKVELLNMGVDDYLTKPFQFDELIARIRALLRRPKQIQSSILKVDDLEVDTTKFRVYRNGQEIQLTRKEFQLLEYLLKNQDNVVSRGMIMEHVWDRTGDLFSNTIETHILNLRKKIEIAGKKKLIHTVPGRGYRLSLV